MIGLFSAIRKWLRPATNTPPYKESWAACDALFNRGDLVSSAQCGCYHCLTIFKPEEIVEWTDDDATAFCPYCGIDSVIPDKCSGPISTEMLVRCRGHWFNRLMDATGSVVRDLNKE